MSNFGSDIFDDEPPPASTRHARRSSKAATTAKQDASVSKSPRSGDRVQEVRLRARRVRPDPDEGLSFPASQARQPEAPERQDVGRETTDRVPERASPPRPASRSDHAPPQDRRPRHGPRSQRRSRQTDPRSCRIAVLIDVEALQQEAEQAGGEISFRKLLRGLATDRKVVAACCLATSNTPKTHLRALAAGGFEVDVLPSANDVPAALLRCTRRVEEQVDLMVLAPAPESLEFVEELAAELGEGRLELTGFQSAADGRHRSLGRECLFIP